MTEQEAKLFLYKFLMKNGIATRYYYNCIYFNDQGFGHIRKQFLELEPKRRLKAIMKSHIKAYRGNNLDCFFDDRMASFAWEDSPEGYRFWHEWWMEWCVKVSNLKDTKIYKDESNI